MSPTTQSLLCCVVLLCGPGEAVLPQRGHCAGDLCAFQLIEDFDGAKKACRDLGGQLSDSSYIDNLKILTSLAESLGGRYWLRSGSGEEGPRLCPSVSLTTGLNATVQGEPCGDKLNGFLCQYGPGEACDRLPVGGGAQVTYTAPMGFELIDSETFPPGTTAVAQKVGGDYPDSKHLCFAATWMRAPWKCEVMRGGCEYDCSSEPDACVCPAGRDLHPNGVTCAADPCADCAQVCRVEGDGYACECAKGYRLAPDGRNCADVDECEEGDPCTAVGEECANTVGGFECRCKDGFDVEDGVCVNVTICSLCEHMDCQKFDGVYRCVCRKGFRVSPKDPTKCEQHCTERDCPAKCIPNPELEKKDIHQCFCPDGYVTDLRNGVVICTDIDECEGHMCDHKCENSFGGYRCLCDDGFALQDEYRCVPLKEEDEDDGSGSEHLTPASSTPASLRPAALPYYVKTGSALGITVFMVLCAVLLFFVARNAAKRCGKFELSTFKHPDLDIFYLQQVTTETYKRLSFDRQFKSDSQRL